MSDAAFSPGSSPGHAPAGRPSLWPLIGVPLLLVALDQITKWWITGALMLNQSRPVVPGFFSLTLVHNPGAAFGLFADSGAALRTAFLGAVSVLAVVLLTVFYLRTSATDRAARAAALLVIGGAIGNLVDRVRFGKVVDFLDVFVGTWHWPAFNVADSCITVGIALFLWTSWRDRGHSHDHSHDHSCSDSTDAAAPAGEEPR
ncbi:MAG: signal peptidase II [Nitrospirota bacterium]|nr:signal peptidase II [Nitrospirota bacterium]